MLAIVRKELADYFNSIRFLVLFLLVLVASAFGLFAAQQGIRAVLDQSGAVTNSGFVFLALFTSSFQNIPSLTFSISLIIPIVGIALGFDAVNSERSGGTLSRLLAQPVYRDSVINGKFLAGIITMTIMVGTTLLLVAGYGLRMIGVPPTAEEIIRLFLYVVLTIVYGAFWMGLSVLFSVVFRRAAGSLLLPIAIFLILYFFWVMLGLGPAIANSIAPIGEGSTLQAQIHNAELQQTLLRLSPSYLFEEAYYVLLIPVAKGLGIITVAQAMYMVPNPLSLSQSLLAIWPHLVGMVSLSAICFAISYIIFMKQEIRAT
ncbi:MAG TPA: ABC transporter permease subunit [Dehalococcoidales bacterium]|nr:ABC transporter permease subunit [Dehalococcoidales bacterium]